MKGAVDLNPHKDEELKIVEQAIDLLREHFDTCHVFVQRHDPAVVEGTITIQRGSGNWYARYGQIRTWLIFTEEEERVKGRAVEE